ncbi:MAG: YkvA family protein [Cyclobacteriaceae bacterium]
MNISDINFKKYKEKATALLQDKKKVQELVKNSAEKIKTVIEKNENLKEFVDQVGLMIRMIKAQFSGEYKDFPWKSTVMVAGALLYFLTPLDLIPDFIPGLGLTDDAAVVYWVYQNIKEDIEKFRQWEISRQSV